MQQTAVAAAKSRLIDAYGERCMKCGRTDRLSVDHVVSRRAGGSDHLSNLQLLCPSCNMAKGIRFADYRPFKAFPEPQPDEKVSHPKTHLTTIRLPHELWDRIQTAAEVERRSANMQIQYYLERGLAHSEADYVRAAHTPTTAPRGEGEGGEGVEK